MAYISASGLQSELGTGYPHRDRALSERYAPLSPDMTDKHDIRSEVCLYTEDDLRTVMAETAYAPVKVWSSKFGNVKGIFRTTRP